MPAPQRFSAVKAWMSKFTATCGALSISRTAAMAPVGVVFAAFLLDVAGHVAGGEEEQRDLLRAEEDDVGEHFAAAVAQVPGNCP